MKALWVSKFCLIIGVLFFFQPVSAQIGGIINTYAKVTNIDVNNKMITFSNLIDVSGGTSTTDFGVGKMVMLIQMKDASIDVTNTSSFGSITAINTSGNYEWAKVIACPTCTGSQIRLATLNKTYNVSGLVQLISVPEYANTTVTSIENSVKPFIIL